MTWTAEEIPDQSGRLAVVTGANSGLGLETARALAGAGAHVIAACRSLDRARAAIADIDGGGPSGRVEAMQLDLASLDSVRSFADELGAAHDRIDLLINNAGVMAPPFSRTADGFESQFGTNHLGHFALTALLADKLAPTEGARIVSLSSLAHRMGKIDFDNLNAERKYRKWKAYGASKLANLLFTLELSRRLQDAGAPAIAVAAHPGYTSTNLQRASLIRFVAPATGMSAERGALPTLYAATAPGVDNNAYFGPGGIGEIWGGTPGAAKRSAAARDTAVAKRLWQVSEQLTGVALSL